MKGLTVRDVVRIVERVTNPLVRRTKLMVIRAVVSGANEALKMRGLSVRMLADDDDDSVEHFEPYGMTGAPNSGAEAIVLSVGGSQDHPVAVVVSDRRNRPTDLAGGEVALWSSHGQRVQHKANGSIDVVPKAGATINHGSASPADAMALASLVDQRLTDIIDAITNAAVGSMDGGATLKTNIIAQLNLSSVPPGAWPNTVASQVNKAD